VDSSAAESLPNPVGRILITVGHAVCEDGLIGWFQSVENDPELAFAGAEVLPFIRCQVFQHETPFLVDASRLSRRSLSYRRYWCSGVSPFADNASVSAFAGKEKPRRSGAFLVAI